MAGFIADFGTTNELSEHLLDTEGVPSSSASLRAATRDRRTRPTMRAMAQPNEDQTRDLIGRGLLRFVDRFRAEATFEADRALAQELGMEARPAVHALGLAVELDPLVEKDSPAELHAVERSADGPRAVELGPEIGPQPEPHASLDQHEALAMATLLGRRAAVLGATPSGATLVVPALCAALKRPLRASLRRALEVAVMEGFVLGREEMVRAAAARSAAAALAPVRLTERSFLLMLAGTHEPELLEEVLDEFARQVLRADALSSLIDVRGLQPIDRATVSVVFAAQASARMIGAQCIFSGVDARWREAMRSAAIREDDLETYERFRPALHAVLAREGLEVRSPWLPKGVRALLRRG